MDNNNIRTMELLGVDDWNHDVYRCIETGVLYKDVSYFHGDIPELCNCGNAFDGEPSFLIDEKLEIHFNKIVEKITPDQKFNYQLLSRLRTDCDYYLSHGNRNEKHLWAGNEQEQINKMKDLYNNFSDDEKPKWLRYEQILQYEKLMIND